MRVPRVLTTIVASGAAVAMLGACAGAGGNAGGGGGDEVTLRVTTPIGGPDHFNNTPLLDWLEAVKQASGGKVDYEMYYGGALVPPAEVGNALSDGVVDIATIGTSYTPADFPVSNWMSTAAFAGADSAPATPMVKSAATLEWWMSNQELLEEDFGSNGIVPLLPGVAPTSFYHMLCKDPVTTLDEAKGKSIRTSGQAWADTVSALGMEPVTIPAGEAFEALQRGVVDCVSTNAAGAVSSGFWDAADDFTPSGFPGFVTWGVFASQATWDTLPDSTKQLLWEHLPRYLQRDAKNAIELDAQFYREAQQHGVTLHEADPSIVQAVEAHQEQVLGELAASAPGSVGDAQGALSQYLELHDTWTQKLTTDLGLDPEMSWTDWAAQNTEVDQAVLERYSELVVAELLDGRRP